MAQVADQPAAAAVERLRRRLDAHIAAEAPNAATARGVAGPQPPLPMHTLWVDVPLPDRAASLAAAPTVAAVAPRVATVGAAPIAAAATTGDAASTGSDLRLALLDALVSFFASFGVVCVVAFPTLVLVGHFAG